MIVKTEQAIQKAETVEQTIKGLLKSITLSSLEVGRLLTLVDEERLWEVMEYGSIVEWASDPQGVDLGKSSVYCFMGVYKKYVLELGMGTDELTGVDITKLDMLKRHITPENKDDMLGLLALSRADMIESLAELSNRKTPKLLQLENGLKPGPYMLVALERGDMTGIDNAFNGATPLGRVILDVFVDKMGSFVCWKQ